MSNVTYVIMSQRIYHMSVRRGVHFQQPRSQLNDACALFLVRYTDVKPNIPTPPFPPMYTCVFALMYSCTHALMYSCIHVLM